MGKERPRVKQAAVQPAAGLCGPGLPALHFWRPYEPPRAASISVKAEAASANWPASQ